MSQARTCARCGAEIAAGEESCARCLLELAAQSAAPVDDAAPAGARECDAPRARPTAPPLEVIAAAFPEYEVLELLGLGGMGAVYKARQKKLDRLVALKILPCEIASDRALAERFLREARALAKLAHPNIVAVHELGESGGFPYLALEYVDGANLRALLREKQLEPRQALAIVKELCDALQYAHDEGIVHRDIKPENVLVDRRGRIKVADFGLAKLVGRVDDGFRTRTDVVMGTPHYMAPEQLEHPRDVDHRADLYALGVVLYEMLTGSLPRGNFELPSARVQVDVRLDSVVLKALEREPSRRYQHAVDVKTDVEAAETTKAGAPSPAAELFVELEAGLGGLVDGELLEGIDHPKSRVFALRLDAKSVFRTLAIWFAFWLLVAVMWNLGAFALGVMVFVGAALVVKSARDLARPAQPQSKGRLAAGGALAALGVTAILIGHVAMWERGTLAHYTPPPLRGLAAAIDWHHEALFGVPQPGSNLVVERVHDVDVPHELFRAEPVVWIVLGLAAVLAGAFVAVAAGRASTKRALTVASGVAIGAAVSLGGLWLFTWFPGRRTQARASSVAMSTSIPAPDDDFDDQVYARLIARDLEVMGQVVGSVGSKDEVQPAMPVTILLAGKSSPLDRWQLTWRGPVCAEPRYVIVISRPPGDGRVRVLVDAGWFGGDIESVRASRTAKDFAQSLLAELGAK